MSVQLPVSKYLPIYLNDHLTGSAFGVSLAHRIAGSNEGNGYGAEVRSIALEIEEDKRTLERLMERLDAKRDPLKPLVAWLGERVGRLKLNGELRAYSPLSRLEELEMLELGIAGKLGLWRALRRALAGDERIGAPELEGLIARAESQRERLESLRLRAAEEALTV